MGIVGGIVGVNGAKTRAHVISLGFALVPLLVTTEEQEVPLGHILFLRTTNDSEGSEAR